MKPGDVQVLNMRPPEIAAAWERGDIDATFIWDPVLSQVKKNGKVLTTSGDICKQGACTFDGLVVSKKFATENPAFMVALVKALAKSDAEYRANPKSWTGDSAKVGGRREVVRRQARGRRRMRWRCTASRAWTNRRRRRGSAAARTAPQRRRSRNGELPEGARQAAVGRARLQQERDDAVGNAGEVAAPARAKTD